MRRQIDHFMRSYSSIWGGAELAVGLLVQIFRSAFVSRQSLIAENLALRQQLIVLKRSSVKRPDIRPCDRLMLAVLYRWFPETLGTVLLVKPETVIRWHRMGFRALWRWKSRSRGGRPTISKETRDMIREMSLANPLWGAPRIHGELNMLGINVAESTVAKYMLRRPRSSGQGWKTFLGNHAADIAACDFLVVPTIGFRMLYAFVVLSHDRRKILHVAVTSKPTAEWTARQIAEAFPWGMPPKYLIRDNDVIYGAVFRAKLKALGIRDRQTSIRSPWQNGYVERVIGSIRRECLDHMIILNEAHLRRVLKNYVEYYNTVRTHLGLEKGTPASRSVKATGAIKSRPYLGGLHHEYVRI